MSVDKPYVEERANGWITKVENLYNLVKDTLISDREIRYKTNHNIVMNEELMAKFSVQPKNVSILDLYRGNKLIATFKPMGLWVIGAKGRIDILTNKGSYILVDVSENDSTPLWKVFTPKNRNKSEPFNAEFINKLVHSK